MTRKSLVGTVCSLIITLTLFRGVSYAQTPVPKPDGRRPGFFTPQQSCVNVEGGAGSGDLVIPPAVCPSGGLSPNQTINFITPCANATEESTTCKFDAYVYAADVSWGGVKNSVYGYTDPATGRKYVIQRSNEKHLTYEIEAGRIAFLEDTTWANTVNCRNGADAMQRITDLSNPNAGGTLTKLQLACGDTNAINAKNAGYEYTSVYESRPMSAATSCDAPFTGDLGSVNELIFHGPARCGAYSGQMMALLNISGAGVGEVLMYCENKGLCAWYQSIDFSNPNNLPEKWTAQTDLCAGFGKKQPICKVATKYVNQQIPLTVLAGLTDIIDNFTGLNITRDISALIPAPSDPDYRKPNLWYGNWFARTNLLEGAVTNDYMPWITKDRTVMSTRDHTMSFKSQICTPNRVTKGEDLIKSGPDRTINTADDGTEWLQAAMGPGVLDPNAPNFVRDNNNKLPEEMTLDEGDCNEQIDGQQPSINQTGSTGSNPYGALGGGSPVINVVLRGIQGIVDLIARIIDPVNGAPQPVSVGHVQSWNYMSRSQAIARNQDVLANARMPAIMNDPEVTEISRVNNSYQDPLGNTNNIETSTNLFKAEFQAKAMRCGVSSHITQEEKPQLGCDTDFTFGRTEVPPPGKPNSLGQIPAPSPGPEDVGVSAPGQLGYTIPFKDTSCRATQETINRAADLMVRYYPSYQAIGTQNLRQQWQDVQNSAAGLGINPLFALTLWIEESAAGGATQATGMGCGPGINPPGGAPAATQTQVRCLGSVVNASQTFMGFMCRYSGEAGWPNCTSFTANPNFPNGVRTWYGFLTGFTSGLQDSCRLVQGS